MATGINSRCGSEENILFFAERGCKVPNIDFLAEPITITKQKAIDRGLTATCLVVVALSLKEILEVFDNAIDSGLFHVSSENDRRRYVDELASILKPGGELFLTLLQ